MPRAKPDTEALLDAMADHVLAHGLNAASLRPLAAAAGTSDRMLIYHFGSKDGLIVALLGHLAARMASGLDAALPQVRAASPGDLLTEVATLMRTPAFRPYARVWLDIVSAAGQGSAAHRAAGTAIIGRFLDWIALRLPEATPDRAATAQLLLTLIEGTLVMAAVEQDATASGAVARLARLLDRAPD